MNKILFILLIWSYQVFALVKIDINSGELDPIPIAIADIEGVNQELTNNIKNVINNDLKNCGLFFLINHEAFIEKLNFDAKINYINWRQISATVVVTAKLEINNDLLKIYVKIWDPYNETLASNFVISNIPVKQYYRAGHKIADKIYSYVTGENPYFDTQIVFVHEQGSGKNKTRRLAIMDQDGRNPKFITSDNVIVLTPRFHPKGNKIVYLSYANKVPQVFMIDLKSGKKHLIGNFPGMSFSPRFSPDGQHLLLSIARNGTTSIHEINLNTNKMKKITGVTGTISTSPSYSPDGDYIVFNSDRNGGVHLYVMDREGNNIQKITNGSGVYGDPVWSPRGDFIAFTKLIGGHFYIGIIRPDGNGERLLTKSWLDEGPTFAPNGRVILFTRSQKNDKSRLYSIDITGYNERIVPTPGNSSGPAWSQFFIY